MAKVNGMMISDDENPHSNAENTAGPFTGHVGDEFATGAKVLQCVYPYNMVQAAISIICLEGGERRDGHSVGGEGHGLGVSKMSSEVVEGAGAGGSVLGNEANEGQHGEPSVLDLLGLVGHEGGLIATGEAKGVEDLATGVAVGHALGGLGDADGIIEVGVVLGAGVLEVHDALGLNPAHHEGLGQEQGACGVGFC